MNTRSVEGVQMGTKGKDAHKVFERPNELKSKAGSGGLPPGALLKAQEAAMAMKDQCLEDVRGHLVELEIVLERERNGDHQVLRDQLSTLAAEVFAFCGTCGLETIGGIAKSLDSLAVKPGSFDEQDFDLIEPHIQALAFAVNEFSKANGSKDPCKALLTDLETAVEGRCAVARG